MTTLEIAATSFHDALAAQTGGAHSVEVSRDLAFGGLTPDPELVRHILDALTIPVYIIVRPTARDFVYTDAEIETILHDAQRFAAMGVTGVVFGAHTPSGMLDLILLQRVAAAAAPVMVTLHRALDTCADPDAALESAAGVVRRVLTSGPASNAWEGRASLRQWVERFGRRVEFVASGGIRLEQARLLAQETHARTLHIGGAARTDDAVDVVRVRALREQLDGA
jgi:copper homeostasis protein